jgi:hypothetical protein
VKKLIFLSGALSVICSDISCMRRARGRQTSALLIAPLGRDMGERLTAWFAENVPNFPENVELSDEARAQSEQALLELAEQELAALEALAARIEGALAEQELAELEALVARIEQAEAEEERAAQAALAARIEQVQAARGQFVITLADLLWWRPPSSSPTTGSE